MNIKYRDIQAKLYNNKNDENKNCVKRRFLITYISFRTKRTRTLKTI